MKKKILVVDDDSVIRNALFEFFTDKGFEVCLASDGAEGFHVFEKETPDLTILDLIMPKMSGVKCLEKIRAINSDAKVAVLTGYGTEDQINSLKQLGVTDIIRKGIGFEDFLAQIQGILDRNKKQFPQANIDPSQVKILVADDDTVIRTLLVEFLVGRGFQVINAKDGREAYEAINEQKPDIVFLDLIMPEKDGNTILTEISEDTLKNTKWVLITGYSDRIKELDGLKGKFQVLRKPFSLENFEEIVAGLLQEYSIKV